VTDGNHLDHGWGQEERHPVHRPPAADQQLAVVAAVVVLELGPGVSVGRLGQAAMARSSESRQRSAARRDRAANQS
jgi:hypothetical protein